ncbi:MAG: helix-turn-helix transcriptional regulator [Rhodospirillales bacterium]
MTAFKDLKKQLLKDPEVRAAYEARAEEYAVVSKLIAARQAAKLTQQEVAERMGTQQAAVARIESGRIKPTLETIERYAAATGHKVDIRLVSS